MKILHIVHNYYPAVGGTELKIQKISEKLVEKYGDDVMVFTSNALITESYHNTKIKLLPAGEEEINGVKIKRLKIFRLPFLFQKMNNLITRFFWKNDLPFNEILRFFLSGPIMPGLITEIILALFLNILN